ncbi:MAG: hypothetical protein Q4B60_02720 [Erysipelotrichaceae bacterium]|nr:hypothetical protein [Erysipelotrichaceae bacterium]
MGKTLKQVYASLKIDDGQLQILVAEYFNTRFNVICNYSSPITGIQDYKIVNKEECLETLKEGVEAVSKKIGAKLEKVILVLPPLNFKKISLKVSVIPLDGIIKKKDIARAITNSLKTHVGDDLIVINTSIVKYTVNGISTRRLPENENCDEAIVDIDLLCADKEMAYSYVSLMAEAGLEVLDLTLNSYAISKESVCLDNSINQNIILLDVGNEFTYLTLLSKGKLISAEIIYEGLNTLSATVVKKYHLPESTINRLIKYNTDFKSDHLDDSIYAWNSENRSNSITVNELNESVRKPLNDFVDRIIAMCKPIMEKGASFCLTGEGSNMKALVDLLKESTGCEVKTYYPDSIGVRNANVAAVYGSLYIYKEKAVLNEISVNCVNIAEYDKTVDQIEINVEGESITSKIKSLFELYKDKDREE